MDILEFKVRNAAHFDVSQKALRSGRAPCRLLLFGLSTARLQSGPTQGVSRFAQLVQHKGVVRQLNITPTLRKVLTQFHQVVGYRKRENAVTVALGTSFGIRNAFLAISK